MSNNENNINSAKSIGELMQGARSLTNKTQTVSQLLNGLRSESGWERLETSAKIALMIMGGAG